MALKPAKATPPEAIAQIAAPDFDFEDAIADQLLDDIDWQKVKNAMFAKVKQRFFDWLVGGGDRPINISPYPELAALSSADDVEKAA